MTTPFEVVAQIFRLGAEAAQVASSAAGATGFAPGGRYNIAPTQMAPVIRVSHTTGERKMEMMRWGLIPYWTKAASLDEAAAGGAKMINARSESLTQKPAFRNLLERRRCLIPADGFYEWLKPASPKERKQPYAIRLKDNRLFAFAGLWDRWKSDEGEVVDSYTILTTKPNEVAGQYHDRMPVMLILPEQWDRWLDESKPAGDVESLLQAPADDTMHAYPVSPRVNSAVLAGGTGELNDDPGLLTEIPAPRPPPSELGGLFDDQ